MFTARGKRKCRWSTFRSCSANQLFLANTLEPSGENICERSMRWFERESQFLDLPYWPFERCRRVESTFLPRATGEDTTDSRQKFALWTTSPIFTVSINLLNLRHASIKFEVPQAPTRASASIHMLGPLAYIGGKRRIANEIIKIFPEHTTYCEVFAGGAQVLFHKEPSKVEVINDLYAEITNFFRICQSHHEELVRYLRFSLVSRRWFELYAAQEPETLTDIQRAARFFYLQKNAFAGLVVNQNYHYTVVRPPSMNPGSLHQLIEKAHRRLERVQIESLPYEEVIRRYDRPTTLFYLDPPYWDRKLYRFNFVEADFVKLEEQLGQVKGKFVLSLNDLPEVRKLFHRYSIRKIDVPYTAQMKPGKYYSEVLITNFVPTPRSS